MEQNRERSHARLFLTAGILALIVLGVGIYFGKAGIGSFISAGSTGKIEKLSTLTAQSSFSEVIGFVIKKYEIDKKHGLDIEFVSNPPGDLERRYLAGETPLMNLGIIFGAEAYKHGIPSTLIGPGLRMSYEVAVRPSSPIRSLEELKGKLFGVLPKTTAGYSSMEIVFRSAGINPSELSFLYGSVPEINQRLLVGTIDAGMVSYPFGAALFGSEAVRSIATLEEVWESNEDGLPMPLAVIGVRDDWYKQNKRLAKKYVDMWTEGSRMLVENPRLIDEFPDYLKANRLDSPAALALLHEKIPKIIMTEWTDREIKGIERFFERAKEYGFVSADTKPPKIIPYHKL